MRTTLLGLLTICGLFFSIQAFTQPTASWLIGSSGTNNNSSLIPGGGGMKSDSLGNSYILGEVNTGTVQYGALSLDSSANSPNWLYIAKIDPAGTPVWIKAITTTNDLAPRDIAVAPSGNFSVGGTFYAGTITFDATHSITSSTGYGYFVAGYDADGNFLWANIPDSISGTSEIYSLSISESNATYFTGYFYDSLTVNSVHYPSPEGTSVFTAKLSSTGSMEWLRQGYTSNSSVAVGQKVTTNADVVYVAGIFRDSITFNSTVIYGDNTQQVFAAKYDTAGTLQWAKLIGGSPGAGTVYGLGTDNALNINIAGTVDEDGGIFNGDTVPGFSDSSGGFVLSCDASGVFRWVDAVFGSYGSSVYDLVTDKNDGNVFVVGNTYGGGLVVAGSGQPVDTVTDIVSNFGYLLKFNSLGQYQWDKIFGGTGYDYAGQLTLQDNSLIVGGVYNDSLTVDNFTISASQNQVFLCRFPITSTGIAELPHPADWKVFPVPANNQVVIQTGASVSTQFLVTDLLGQILSRQIFNGYQTTLDLSSFPSGVYIVTMQNNNGDNSSKLIVKE